MKKITLEIDGKKTEVEEGTTVLEAAEKLDIKIPTLCYKKSLSPYGSCRLCLVEIVRKDGTSSIQTSCTHPALPDLVVRTDTERVIKRRKIMIELLLARCPDSERIRDLAREMGVEKTRIKPKGKDCILCGLCVRMCRERMARSAINFVGRGQKKELQSPFGKPNEVCQSCGACDFICPTGKIILPEASKTEPVPIPDEFNVGLASRPAVNTMYPQAVPNVPAIDERYCARLLSGDCEICKAFCEAEAIDFEQKEEMLNINAGAVVFTPGVGLFDTNTKKEYGYDRYENVITGIQFERLLSSSGPTLGEVLRPFDGKAPKKVAFIQCVGSRDPSCGNEFCSSVCCMYSIKQAIIAREHDPRIEPTIFYIDIRSFGKDFERYYENAKEEYGIKFVKCIISKIYEKPKTKNLMVKFLDAANTMREDEFDLVVLASGLTQTEELKPLAEKSGIGLNEYGFAQTDRNSPGLTSREGIYVAGTYAEPKDIPETVAEGSSSAALASALLKDARGSLIKEKEYPPERDVSDEDIRIGVFICRCGRNIAAVVNVPEVVEYAATLKNVVYADEFLYSCSKDSLDIIKEKVAEHDLNRVVVASCTPRTHEELFRDTVRETGLNRYLFEMTSLREQVSWVHKDYPEEATQKARELVAMMVAKTRRVRPLERDLSDVIHSALVVGGGASGMQAALGVAEQGYEVFLVEKEDKLGGHLRELFDSLEGESPQELLKRLVEKVSMHEKIHVMTNSTVKTLSGFKGNYTSLVDRQGEEIEIQHGVVVLATGAQSYEPKAKEFGYGESPDIITQANLEEMLAKGSGDFSQPKTFVMIQCVGSRNDEHPYCSRVCCAHAVKNAIKLKKLNPEHKIIVLYRDIRTYGFMEKYYLRARESGVIFLRFEADSEPRVAVKNGHIKVKHADTLLGETVTLEPDFLVLSAGITAGDNEELGKTFKVPLNMDRFFMEAHAKIRPLDFTTEGMFFCGLAHSPRFLHESLTQAGGTSIRAVTILSKDKIEAEAITAVVNERLCKGCGLCVSICPFDAREMDDETKTARVISTLCQGCGACAVTCPGGATSHKGFTKKQIMDMVDKAAS